MDKLPLTAYETASLGALIGGLKRCNREARVYLMGRVFPLSANSYRGYYDHLALSYWNEDIGQDKRAPTVGALVATLETANGKTYEGYKGGNYKMNLETPVWVDNWGDCTSTAIVGIVSLGSYRVVLQTATVDS